MLQHSNSSDQDYENININVNQNNQQQNNHQIHKLNQQNQYGMNMNYNQNQSNQQINNHYQHYLNNYQQDLDQNQSIKQYEPGQKKKQSILPKLLEQSQTTQLKQDINIKNIQRQSIVINNNSQPVFNILQNNQDNNNINYNNQKQNYKNDDNDNDQYRQQNEQYINEEINLMPLSGVNQLSNSVQLYKQQSQFESDEEKDHQQQVEQIEDVPTLTNQNDLIIIDNLQIGDMHQFITKPLQKGVLLQCTIKRDKSGISNKFYPKYHVGLSNGFKYLMSAKKKSYNKTSNYYISLNQSDPCKKDNNFIGKVRSNFMGTEFNIYNNGQNPQKASNFDQVRKQIGVVMFETNIMGTKGPRKMKVLVPEIGTDGVMQEFRPINSKEGLLHSFRNNKNEGIKYLFNKPPKWNEQASAFVLNFNGRVDKASVKNFQLIEQSNDELVYLQFGRINKDMFNMDIQYPLSPLQAFAICLTSFDNKLACE